jgi:hypothetical protein
MSYSILFGSVACGTLAEHHQVIGVHVQRDVGEDHVVIIVGQLIVVELGIVLALRCAVLALEQLYIAADIADAAFVFCRVHARIAHDLVNRRRDLRWAGHARADRGERDQIAVVAFIAVDLHVHVVQIPQQLRVDALHMIGLVEGVDRCLPVAVPLHRDVARPRHALEMIGVQDAAFSGSM